jgi:CheY-like chemotaxis protein
VRLPVLPSREAGSVTAVAARPAAAGPTRLDYIHVLLVARQLLALILEVAGAKVTSTASVREALAVLDTLRPNVIVSDIGMPDEDGYSLIRQVRAREAGEGKGISAIALTGYVRPEDAERLLAAGFQTHLRKPVEPEELVVTVAALAAIRGPSN